MTYDRQLINDWGVTGLTGSMFYTIRDAANAIVVARTNAGVSEFPAGSGTYFATVTLDDAIGVKVVWDDDAGESVSEWIPALSTGAAAVEENFRVEFEDIRTQ